MADGFWILATKHRPGGSRSFPEINNRCLVFRLVENGTPILLVINGVDARAIPEVERIEKHTGLAVRYVLSPGGGHHLLLPPWVCISSKARARTGHDRGRRGDPGASHQGQGEDNPSARPSDRN